MKKSLFFLIFFFNLSILSGWSQTTHDFTTNATLSYGTGGFGIWNTQADITIGGVAYKLTCGGNGSFVNSTNGGVSNSKCLIKDGSGGDQFTLQRTDGQPFQFYGMWVKHQSMNSYSSFYTLPPWYTLTASGVEDQNGNSQTMYTYQDMTAMTAGTAWNNYTGSSITINSGTGGVTVSSVQISFQAILYFWIDNIIVGPAVSNNTAPVVTTTSAATITTTSAVLGGNVTSDGGASVSERGVVYSSNLNPTISDSKLIIGSGLGTFSNTLSLLPDATTYHYRAYARNSIGTSYGSDATFTTATVNNPCDVNRKYDKIVSGYHSSIALSGNGEFLVWGQNIASNGTASVAPPISITDTNFSGVSGTVLFTSLGGIGSGGNDQFVALSTGGLYAWGKSGAILNTALKSTTPFGLITTPIGGDTTTKLPIGVAPTDVTMLFAMYQTLAIVANGNVWVLVNTDANLQGDGTSLAATTWHKVKISASVDLTNVIAIRGQVSKTTGQSAMMALTSLGEAYTWGSTTYLGNNTSSTSKNYATLMTLPAEFNSTNKPKTIGVTGSSQTAIPNTLYVLSYSGSLYALGDNSYKQCGDFTSTERKSWVNVKSSSTTNFSNIAFFSTQEHTAKMAGVAAITFTGDLYSWGDNDGYMLGRPTATVFYDPGIPIGFTSGSDKAIFTELGGHTLVYVKEGSDRFCYVGHRTEGSMGESTTSSGDVTTFDCSNTPVISLCGAVPIAANVNNSTINVSTASIPADGTTTSTITIQLKDSSNNNLTTTGGNVQVFTSAGTLGLITDNNNGTYTLTLTSSQLSEVATITFSVNGVSSSNSTSVSFVLPSLILTSFTPTTGTSGTQVSITGQNFTGVNSVKFNNVEATAFTVNSATSITATAPVNVQTGVIKVTANSQSHQGQSIVDSFSNASCTTGWSNAWQTITNNNNNNAITAVRLNIDNASVNTYGLYLELHNADLNSASANPFDKFNQTTLIGTSSTTNVAQQGMGMVQFNFANTILLSPSTNYYIVLKGASGNPAGTGQQRITFSCSNTDGGAGNNFGTLEFELETSPVFRVSTAITINSSSLTSFSSCLGAASSQQTFTVSGVGLTNDVVVTAPTGFEVSLTTGSGFGSSVTIVASGTLSATTVYLRLAASATGTPSGNLTIATQGLTTQNIAISGTITTIAAAASSQTNLACNGGTNGAATVLASGGTAPYTYSWSPSGGTSATASGLSAGVYTCTVTDANGCSATRSFTLTQPVVLAAAASSQTNLACNGGTNGAATVLASGGTTPYTYSWSPSGGTSATASGLSAGVYTCTVTDANGCSATRSFTLTQPVAVTAPTSQATQLFCVGNTIANLVATVNSGETLEWYAASIGGIALVNTTSIVAGTTYYVQALNSSGCVSSRTAVLTLSETTLPTVITQSVIVQLNASGTASVTAAQVNNGSTDNCSIATIVVNPSTFTAANVGANTVTLTVTDVNGNVNTGTATVTVQDNILPTVITQNFTIALNASGTASITASQINNGSTDNSGIATIVVSPTNFSCANIGANTVTLTVTDVNGNVNTGTAIVTVTDTTLPIVITQAITTYLDSNGQTTITAAQINNGSTDNCSINTITVSPTSFTCANVGANIVTLTVTDVNGNVATATAIVTVAFDFTTTGDNDFDSLPDNCDIDDDNDGVRDNVDNCPLISNMTQIDTDMDGMGNVCDGDDDNDGVIDEDDNCPLTYNPNQEDRDNDGLGDVCDTIEINISQVITPNGDGVNDTWMIYNIENHPNNVVKVYNRWGDEVFYAKNYQNNWAGTYKTKNVPDASSYYYQIDLDGDGSIDKDGWIYISK